MKIDRTRPEGLYAAWVKSTPALAEPQFSPALLVIEKIYGNCVVDTIYATEEEAATLARAIANKE